MMTHKQTKSNRRMYEKYKEKTKYVNNEASYIVNSKPLLISSEDDESLAFHSARARMLMQTKKIQVLRKYTLVGENVNSINRTVYHISPIKASIIPTYQTSIQNIRWNPYMETRLEEPQFNTRKHNCIYQYKEYPEPYLQYQNNMVENKKISSFKDNIIRYSDNSTMTWTMNDVGCGVDIPIVQNLNEKAYESTTNLAISDRSQTFTSQLHHLPVLEKSEYEANMLENDLISKNHEIDDNSDLSSNYDKCKKLSKFNRKEAKMADMMVPAHGEVKRFPNLSRKTFSMTKLTEISDSTSEDCKISIPHNHRVHSKYHCNCTSISNSHDDNVFIRKLNFKNVQNLIQCKRTPSIRLPKRVVASQRDITVFIGKCK